MPGVVDPPLLLTLRGQNPHLIHDDQIAMGCQVGHEIRVVHDAVDRMQELRIELARYRVVDLRPFHGAIVHQAEVGIDGEVGERVGRRGQAIEEFLQVGLGDIPMPAPAARSGSGRPASFRWCGGDGLQVLDKFHPIQFPDCSSHSAAKPSTSTSVAPAYSRKRSTGSCSVRCGSRQQLAQVRRELAVIVETGRVGSNGDRVFLRAAFGLIPMGNEADNFSPDFGLGDGSQHIQWGHAADNTKKPPPAQ